MKNKVSFSIEPKLQTEAECLKQSVDCNSMSEFYEKAVQHYIMHLHLKNNESYFGEVVSKTLEGMIDSLGDRITKIQFKNAVTTEKLVELLADYYDWSDEDFDNLSRNAVENVRCIHGTWRDI